MANYKLCHQERSLGAMRTCIRNESQILFLYIATSSEEENVKEFIVFEIDSSLKNQ
jgi:hypothetical protein